jgi:membrane-bound metal-dependent hydrolase YbcI (DUF457 family)
MSVSEVLIQLILASALGVPLLVFLGFVGLRQFKLILTILSELSSPRGSLPAIIRPYVSKIYTNLELSFGPHQKFTPNLTQVLLAAVVLAILLLTIRIGGLRRR